MRSPTESGVNVLPVGAQVAEFEIVDLIGEGGFGIVYLAYDHSLHRHVALKEYMPSGLASRTRAMHVTVKSEHHASTFKAGLKSFVNEARLLAQFDSPSLVKVYRFWEANGTAYMVMPFYEGVTLKQALKERRITPTEEWIKAFLADLLDAIETIHRVLCFHRDIAPDKILLLKDGRPLLLDFGAARRVIEDLTHSPTVILKPGFAPIEQYAKISGLRQGAWTDVYALAAVVYYLITGQRPPPAVTRMVDDDMKTAREAGRGRYSEAFLAAIDRALAVRPEQRIQTVAELRRALDLDGEQSRTVALTRSAQPGQEDSERTRFNTSAGEWPTPQPPPRAPAATANRPGQERERMRLSGEPGEQDRQRAPTAKAGQERSRSPTARTEYSPRQTPPPRNEYDTHRTPATRTEYVQRRNLTGHTGPDSSPPAAQHMEHERPPTLPDRDRHPPQAQRAKSAWFTLTLLLLAGIASGIYIGGQHLFRQPERTAAPARPAVQQTPPVASNEAASQAEEARPSRQAESPRPSPAQQAPTQQVPLPQVPLQQAPSQASPAQQPPAQLPQRADSGTPGPSASPPPVTAATPSPAPASPRTEALPQQTQPAAPNPATDAIASTGPTAGSRLQSSGSSGEQTEPAPTRSSREEELWRSAKSSDDTSAYDAYLKRYPKGRYAAEARLRLKRKAAEKALAMTAPPKTGTVMPRATDDDRDWASTAASNQAAAYEGYLARHPNGRYIALAREKLAMLRPKESSAATQFARTEPSAAAADTRQKNASEAKDTSVPSSSPSSTSASSSSAIAPSSRPSTEPATTASLEPQTSRLEPPAPAPSSKPPESKAAQTVTQQNASGDKKSIRLDDQTVTGNFSLDPGNGAVSGKVHIVWDNGDQYDGTLVHGQKEGSGQFVWKNGQRYRGEWRHDQPNGRGTIWFTNGSRYQGEVRNGVPDGSGTIAFPNGDHYEGKVSDGKPNGQGSMRYKNGDRYEGTWANGKSQGQGRLTWADGSYWEGEFSNDKRTDNGKMVYAGKAPANTASATGSGTVPGTGQAGSAKP